METKLIQERANTLPAAKGEVTLSQKEIEIIGVIVDVNALVSFKLTDTELEHWARILNRLKPDLDESDLCKIMDNFLLGKTEWDARLGIQNIFKALNAYKQVI